MSHIARFDGRNAPARTVRCAAKARTAGFQNVQTHYEPQTDSHTVTGELPATTAQRTIDQILGR